MFRSSGRELCGVEGGDLICHGRNDARAVFARKNVLPYARFMYALRFLRRFVARCALSLTIGGCGLLSFMLRIFVRRATRLLRLTVRRFLITRSIDIIRGFVGVRVSFGGFILKVCQFTDQLGQGAFVLFLLRRDVLGLFNLRGGHACEGIVLRRVVRRNVLLGRVKEARDIWLVRLRHVSTGFCLRDEFGRRDLVLFMNRTLRASTLRIIGIQAIRLLRGRFNVQFHRSLRARTPSHALNARVRGLRVMVTIVSRVDLRNDNTRFLKVREGVDRGCVRFLALTAFL